jgi:hypothetical protein
MRQSLHGATDAATMVLFWPELLPDDFQARFENDPFALLEQLRAENRAIWFPCDSDGDYHLSIFIDCEIPEELRKIEKAAEIRFVLHAKGPAYFGGGEYLFKHDNHSLTKHPHMRQRAEIPDGIYDVKSYCLWQGECHYEDWMLQQVGLAAKRRWELFGAMVACSIVGMIATLFACAFLSWPYWSPFVGAEACLILSAIMLHRSELYQRAEKANREYGVRFPSYIVELTSRAAAGAT